MEDVSEGQKEVVFSKLLNNDQQNPPNNVRKLDLTDTVFHKMKVEMDTKEHNVKEKKTLEPMYDNVQQIEDGVKRKEKEILEVYKYNY